MKGDGKSLSFVEDTAVAPEKLRDYIERFLADRARPRHGRRRLRARVGRLPARAPGRQHEDGRGRAAFEAIANDIADLVLEFGGALSGEHGDGMVRGPFTEKMFGPALYERVPHRQAHVRSGRPLQPRQDHRHAAVDGEPALRRRLPDAGSAGRASTTPSTAASGARSRCAAASASAARRSRGRCARRTWRRARKSTRRAAARTRCGWRWRASSARRASATTTSTTCSTSAWSAARARPSARSASTSRASRASSSPATGAAMACRCASRAIGHARAAVGDRQPLRAAVEHRRAERRRTVDQRAAARHRSAPHAACLARETFARRFARDAPVPSPQPHRSPQSPAPSPWCGSLQRHVHQLQPPGNRRRRGFDVLEAAGQTPRLVPHGCCGRPLISQGLLDEARAAAQANADALHDAAARGERIVFLEPSCLSAVREDAPDAVARRSAAPGTGGRRTRACCSRTTSSEEWREGRINLALRPGPSTVLLHGHCHQKAMGLMPSARALLGAHPIVHGRRSRCRMLRDGRLVRLREGALRRVAPDRRAQAAAGRAGHGAGRSARRRRHLVPRTGGPLHRRTRACIPRSCWLRSIAPAVKLRSKN